MSYMTTYKEKGDNTYTAVPYATAAQARTAALKAAEVGHKDCQVWTLVASVEIKPHAFWTDVQQDKAEPANTAE